jgi:hypothetical protein
MINNDFNNKQQSVPDYDFILNQQPDSAPKEEYPQRKKQKLIFLLIIIGGMFLIVTVIGVILAAQQNVEQPQTGESVSDTTISDGDNEDFAGVFVQRLASSNIDEAKTMLNQEKFYDDYVRVSILERLTGSVIFDSCQREQTLQSADEFLYRCETMSGDMIVLKLLVTENAQIKTIDAIMVNKINE